MWGIVRLSTKSPTDQHSSFILKNCSEVCFFVAFIIWLHSCNLRLHIPDTVNLFFFFFPFGYRTAVRQWLTVLLYSHLYWKAENVWMFSSSPLHHNQMFHCSTTIWNWMLDLLWHYIHHHLAWSFTGDRQNVCLPFCVSFLLCGITYFPAFEMSFPALLFPEQLTATLELHCPNCHILTVPNTEIYLIGNECHYSSFTDQRSKLVFHKTKIISVLW